jgi:hypothetical protein
MAKNFLGGKLDKALLQAQSLQRVQGFIKQSSREDQRTVVVLVPERQNVG